MPRFFYTLFFISTVLSFFSQSRVTLSNNIIVTIKNGGVVTINNSNDNALSQVNGGGSIVSEGENNALQWVINTNMGNYNIPFATNSFVPIPLQLSVTNAGVTSSLASVYFSTYETINDDNTNYPSDVTNMNSNCSNNNGLFAVDRFWRIEATHYTTKPTVNIDFGYNFASNEIGVTNTIVESQLKAQRFNNTINSWETPQKLYGTANVALKTINSVVVNSSDFYKTWALIDTSSLSLPITVINSATTMLCAGSAATITANGATQYTLLPNNIINTTGNFVVTPSVSVTYTVISSVGTGTAVCLLNINNVNAITTLSINPLPSITTSVSSIVCYGANTGAVVASITSTLPVTYTWSTGSHATTISSLGAGIYTVYVMDNLGCRNTFTSSVSQPTSAVSLVLNSQNPRCYLDTNGFITATVNGGTPNYSYTWQPNGINTNLLTNVGVGDYTLHITDANGCKTHSVVSLTQALTAMQTIVTHSVEPNCDEVNGTIYTNTTGGVSPYQYQWLTNGSQNSYANFISEGNYTLFVTDSYGCIDTLTTMLACVAPLSIPQLFTPNADGKNDVFEIKGIERYPNNTLEVYNRWGSLVYQKTNYQNTWSGKYHLNTESLPAATYFIVLHLGDAIQKIHTGYVELRY